MKKVVPLAIVLVVLHLTIITVVHAEQSSQARTDLDPVYDPAYKGTTYSGLGGPFLIQVNDSSFRRTASYPRGETMAEGIFLFVEVKIFNNSPRALQIPRFTLRDPRGTIHLTAIRARRSNKAILGGESLNPGASKRGYLIFDVPSLSGIESFPLRYKLLIANSRHTIDVNVYRKVE